VLFSTFTAFFVTVHSHTAHCSIQKNTKKQQRDISDIVSVDIWINIVLLTLCQHFFRN